MPLGCSQLLSPRTDFACTCPGAGVEQESVLAPPSSKTETETGAAGQVKKAHTLFRTHPHTTNSPFFVCCLLFAVFGVCGARFVYPLQTAAPPHPLVAILHRIFSLMVGTSGRRVLARRNGGDAVWHRRCWLWCPRWWARYIAGTLCASPMVGALCASPCPCAPQWWACSVLAVCTRHDPD